MLIEGKFGVQAPIQKVWDTLFDPQALLSCVPGAEKIEQVDERTFNCIIKQKVGPITVKFKVKNTLIKVVSPNYIEFYAEGEDITRTNHISMKSVVNITEPCAAKVEVSYTAPISVTGKLSMFGDRIMRAKAKQIQEDFTRALSEKVRGVSRNGSPAAPKR